MSSDRKGGEAVEPTTLVLGLIAVVLLIVALMRGRGVALAGVLAGGRTLWRNLAVLLLGFLIAGLAQVLIPRQVISQWLGGKAGFQGVLIGCVAGGLVPGAPQATFPLVAALYRSGASLGAVVGFVTAWALWSVTRLPVEIALIDTKPALVRYAVTFLVPPLAGWLAQLIERYAL
jgi:uncharacterized membrane protein YraQ (UPF0718 family)